MAENPDRENETMIDFLPVQGMLRYVSKPVRESDNGVVFLERTLQQYQFSASDNKNDWYDVPTVDYVEVVQPEAQQENSQQEGSDALQVAG